jgi:hypothetical protein
MRKKSSLRKKIADPERTSLKTERLHFFLFFVDLRGQIELDLMNLFFGELNYSSSLNSPRKNEAPLKNPGKSTGMGLATGVSICTAPVDDESVIKPVTKNPKSRGGIFNGQAQHPHA